MLLPAAWVQGLRVLRAIKPLRALTRSAGMQQIFKSLTLSLAAMGNVSMVVLLFFLIFGILGVQVGRTPQGLGSSADQSGTEDVGLCDALPQQWACAGAAHQWLTGLGCAVLVLCSCSMASFGAATTPLCQTRRRVWAPLLMMAW